MKRVIEKLVWTLLVITALIYFFSFMANVTGPQRTKVRWEDECRAKGGHPFMDQQTRERACFSEHGSRL